MVMEDPKMVFHILSKQIVGVTLEYTCPVEKFVANQKFQGSGGGFTFIMEDGSQVQTYLNRNQTGQKCQIALRLVNGDMMSHGEQMEILLKLARMIHKEILEGATAIREIAEKINQALRLGLVEIPSKPE